MTEQMNLHKCAVKDRNMSWHSIDWKKAHEYVRKLQSRIAKAQKKRKKGKRKSLQRLLTTSFYGRALAVKRVIENKGKNCAGVDGITWKTPSQKWEAVQQLKRYQYNPQPLRRVNIPKSNGKLRPLSIPTMKDRAMQALHLLALSPIAETKSDPNSYGFRIGRSCADASSRVFQTLCRKTSSQWIIDADIKGCFDNISHQWMLKNIPMDKKILGKWLKSGVLIQKEYYPTTQGSPQGGIISPTLANMVLDGLERQVLRAGGATKSMNKNKVHITRYADDLVVTGSSKDLLKDKIIPAIKRFLKIRGLELSEEKTKIVHISEGFDFLGMNFKKYKTKLLVTPSKQSIQQFKDKIRAVFKAFRGAPARALIQKLNPIIKGWAYYHRHHASKATFIKLERVIFQKLHRWMKRQYRRKSWKWRLRKHMREYKGWQTFSDVTKEGKIVYLIGINRIPIKRHQKIIATSNPYLKEWETYFEIRFDDKLLTTMKSKLVSLYYEQEGKCSHCNEQITLQTGWQSHHIIQKYQGGSDLLENLTLLHPNCHRQLHSSS
jgi:RNA-directed DNA polymerase